jgi:hypothetical protein
MFRKAARALTAREGPVPRRRKTGGSAGGGLTARKLATDYVKLCQHPTGDLCRWLAEITNGGEGRETEATARGRESRAYASKSPTDTYRIRGHPLHEVRSGLDAYRHAGRQTDNLPARPPAGPGRYDELRSLRAEAAASRVASPHEKLSEPDLSSEGDRSMIEALYGAKIEATRRGTMPARDKSAAIRAILDERSAALRDLTLRRRYLHMGLRMLERQARAPPRDEPAGFRSSLTEGNDLRPGSRG